MGSTSSQQRSSFLVGPGTATPSAATAHCCPGHCALDLLISFPEAAPSGQTEPSEAHIGF